jgi:hypothetical protein
MSTKLTLLAVCLFIVGLSLLLFSFVKLILALRQSKSSNVSSKNENVWLRVLLLVSGIVMVLLSQSFFWFNSNLKSYSILNNDNYLARISILRSDLDKPRLILEAFTKDNRLELSDDIILEDSLFQIEMEVIRFKRLGNLLGLHDYYRFSRLIYLSGYQENEDDYISIQLGSKESKLPGVISGLRKVLKIAHYNTFLTDPLTLGDIDSMTVSFSDVGLLEMTSLDTNLEDQ